jgi:hypothetical protein
VNGLLDAALFTNAAAFVFAETMHGKARFIFHSFQILQ